MSDETNEVRINVIVSWEENNKISELLPRGTKSNVLRNLIKIMIENLENDKEGMFCAALLRNKVRIVRDEDD